MNYKLVFSLSLFGLAMAFATIYWITNNFEAFVWLGIFVFSAYIIAKQARRKYFLHGFLVSILNCVWITLTHVILYSEYVDHHPEDMEMMAKISTSISPRMMMLLTLPLIGVLTGLILGLFSFIASKLVRNIKFRT